MVFKGIHQVLSFLPIFLIGFNYSKLGRNSLG